MLNIFRQLAQSGRVLKMTPELEESIKAIFALDKDQLYRMDTVAWSYLSAAFDLSIFTHTATLFRSSHAYQ